VNRKVYAIVPSAGSGRRFGPEKNKLFLPLGGKPVLIHTLETLNSISLIADILPVVREEDLICAAGLVEEYGLSKIRRIIPGGAERQDSVYNALKAIDDETSLVLIHDGGRPFATADIINNTISQCDGFDGVIAAVRVKDTIKEIDGASRTPDAPFVVRKTLERELLYAVQTPQVFPFSVILNAHEQARREGFYATDDAALVERYGGRIGIVEGSYRNIKITTPEDLIMAEVFLKI
jgi:2-C-methyl-D-erythritol 4-phosphate cytidylyltransferase